MSEGRRTPGVSPGVTATATLNDPRVDARGSPLRRNSLPTVGGGRSHSGNDGNLTTTRNRHSLTDRTSAYWVGICV